MLNTQTHKLAAPGCGVIVYRRDENGSIIVLLSKRSAKVGVGYGITGGGFVECGSLMAKSIGTILESADEAYREALEENLGFGDIISLAQFRERAQPLASFAVHTADSNGVHACTYFGLAVSKAEWDAMTALPPSDERDGDLVPALLIWTRNINRTKPEDHIVLHGAGDFFHAHEQRAFGMLAWLASRNRLWTS